MKEYDYIIIGSGIAGLYTALLAREHGPVLIVTKGTIEDCNTRHAQGGVAAAVGPGDSPELHMMDTLSAGAGLSDPEMVRILTTEGPDRITDLINLGVPFDTLDGQVALTREAAHSLPRILHAGGDATGAHIETTLSRLVRASRNITVLEYCLATGMLLDGGKARGVRTLDLHAGAEEEFVCRSLILASGGAGRLFRYTTNPDVATGDGLALAYRAGAELTDMEFMQFHPTALRLSGVPPFLISEAVRGEGGVLRNVLGEVFMTRYSPEGDLAPRDIVARGILQEMRRTRASHVYLDVRHLPPRTVSARFPQIYRFCREHGLDITTSPIPVAPAAHYFMGGVRTDVWGETNIPGLFACGEVACTGVHGANRLASNSLLEVLIFSKRILVRGQEARAETQAPLEEAIALPRRDPASAPPLTLAALQGLMWDEVGILRGGEGLERAAGVLAFWEKALPAPSDRPSYELGNLVLVGRLMAEAALLRQESRGAHFRTDFPHPSQSWLRHNVFRAPL